MGTHANYFHLTILYVIDSSDVNQCSYVYMAFKLGKTPVQINEELVSMLGEPVAAGLRTVFRWVASIKDGSFTLEKGISSGRPRSVRTVDMVNKVQILITKDSRLSRYDIAMSLGISQSTAHHILTEDLNLKVVCSVWVPAALSPRNKLDRIACCKRILKSVPLIKVGITLFKTSYG